jgi:hypothetical protein
MGVAALEALPVIVQETGHLPQAKGAVRGTGWQDAAGVSAELPDSRSGISSLHTTLRQKGHVGCLALG